MRLRTMANWAVAGVGAIVLAAVIVGFHAMAGSETSSGPEMPPAARREISQLEVRIDGIEAEALAQLNRRSGDWSRNLEMLGKVLLFEIRDGTAVKVSEVAGGEAAQGIVFSQDGKQVILQMDVEKALAVYAVRDGKLADTGERIKLSAGPVSLRSMPR